VGKLIFDILIKQRKFTSYNKCAETRKTEQI
jgi:hypothetical protein